MVSRLMPRILHLQNTSRAPITVYIDSPGGSLTSMEMILQLLRLANQDSSDACHIITAVTIRAASAAADLLSSGDYSTAFPTSTLLYHGTRQQTDLVTVETSSMLANLLRFTNDVYARELGRKIEDRFSFRFVLSRPSFDGIRTKHSNPGMTNLDCFLEFIGERLSPKAKLLWDRAKKRYEQYNELVSATLRKVRFKRASSLNPKVLEASLLKAIIDFQLKRNRRDANWRFRDQGLNRLADDFFLIDEFLTSYNDARLSKWCMSFGKYLLSPTEVAALDAITNKTQREEKTVKQVRPLVEPLWSFFVALCHALQEGENELTATDAYWLGLIDEVIGNDSLFSLRAFEEYKPDPTPPAVSDSTTSN